MNYYVFTTVKRKSTGGPQKLKLCPASTWSNWNMSENSAWQTGSSGKWAPSKSTGRATPLWQPSWSGEADNSVQPFPSASCLWVLCGQLLPASTELSPYVRDCMALNTESEWISGVSFKLLLSEYFIMAPGRETKYPKVTRVSSYRKWHQRTKEILVWQSLLQRYSGQPTETSA